jgi:hypothetical protein
VKSNAPSILWRRSLLLGCACYAASNGLVHVSDWYYLAASAAVAGVVSVGLRPMHWWLVARPPRGLRSVPLLWPLGCTLAVFGLGVLLTWPLHSWPGPDGVWPWGAGALVATMWDQWRPGAPTAFPKIGTKAA